MSFKMKGPSLYMKSALKQEIEYTVSESEQLKEKKKKEQEELEKEFGHLNDEELFTHGKTRDKDGNIVDIIPADPPNVDEEEILKDSPWAPE